MAFKVSKAARNFMLADGSLREALQGGKMLIYSGSQPSTADAAPNGSLLVTITGASQTHTEEVIASGSITLDSGASGSVDDVTVDGVSIIDDAVPFNASLAQTAIDLAAEINNSTSSPEYTAEASSTTVTIKAKRGAGAAPNTFVVAGTLTTLTASYVALSGGVNSANGLKFASAAGAAITKDSTQSWTGLAGATGTAGWFRIVGAVADSGVADATESQIRVDGQISSTGAELNLPNLTVQSGATQTVTSFQISFPTA